MQSVLQTEKLFLQKAPFLQYEQFLLDKNFRQYLGKIMVYKKILRMGVQKTSIQNTNEISTGFLLDPTAQT